MHYTITRFVKFEGLGSLKAFCDVSISDLFLIKGIRVVEGRTGHFVSMPRQQGRGGKWYDSVVPLRKETKAELSRIVLEAFHASRTEETTLACSASEHRMQNAVSGRRRNANA